MAHLAVSLLRQGQPDASKCCGKRADGYHDLASLVHTISLADDLRIDSADRAAQSRRRPRHRPRRRTWSPARRACWRRRLARAPGAELTLVKRIPAAAGLGGGSSDAATDAGRPQQPVGHASWPAGAGRRWRPSWAPTCPSFCAAARPLMRGRGDELRSAAAAAEPVAGARGARPRRGRQDQPPVRRARAARLLDGRAHARAAADRLTQRLPLRRGRIWSMPLPARRAQRLSRTVRRCGRASSALLRAALLPVGRRAGRCSPWPPIAPTRAVQQARLVATRAGGVRGANGPPRARARSSSPATRPSGTLNPKRPARALPGRPMVGLHTLDVAIQVRILAGQPRSGQALRKHAR